MYTLYYKAGACSMAVHVLLNELNQPVTLKNIILEGETKDPEFLKINPRGQVPTLVEDGFVMREGGAILAFLADKHQSPLLPQSGHARATALEWLMFCNATLHPAYGRVFGAMRLAPGEMREKLISAGIENINKLWQDVDAHLANSPYLAGKDMTVGDILITVIANWSARMPAVQLGSNVKRLLKTVSQRPAYQKALAAEHIEYKAAA